MSLSSQILGPPPTDFVNHMLTMIFGPIWTAIATHGLNLASVAAAPAGPLGAGFFVLDTLVFSFITFYVVKTIFEGVAGTAYHGEWLGKRFHTFWTPLRIVLMLMLIAPVAGGYSISQVVVLWTANKAIGVADKVAEKMMPIVAKQGAIYNDPLAPSAKKIAANLFLDYVCMDTLNDHELSASKPIIHVQALGNKKWTTYDFSGAGEGLPPQTCGSVQLRTPPMEIAMSESTGMSAMLSLIKPAASKFERIAAGESPAPQRMPENLVTNAAKAYTNSVMKAVRKYAEKKNKRIVNGWNSQIKSDGFAVLGDYMAQIAGYDGKISSLAREQPHITPPLDATAIGLTGYGLRDILSAARTYVHERNPGLSNPKGLPSYIPKSQTKGKGWFAKKMTELINGENEYIAAFNSLGSSSEPLGAVQAFGVRVTAITTGLIGMISIIGGITEIVALPAVMALFGLFFPLLIVGVTLGYIIPLVPYLIYFMAIIGWVAAVVTAVVGAPLWAAAHVLPDDTEGFVPNAAAQGYKLLLSIFTKPALIVFGFILSREVFDAGAWLIDKTFLFVSRSVLGGTTTNGAFGAILASLAGMIALGFVVLVLYWKLADWSFGLIHTLPDRALEWAGLNDISVGEERNHDLIIGTVVSAHRHGQEPGGRLLTHSNAGERAARNHARQARFAAQRPGQADAAGGEAGDA